MSQSSQRSTRTLRNWFVITAFAVLGLVFFFGALNTFRQESAAAEASAYPILAAQAKTVFVVCRPGELAADTPDAPAHTTAGHQFAGLMRVVAPSGVDALFTTDRTGGPFDSQPPTDLDGVPIETIRAGTPNSLADAILRSEHRVVIAVADEDSIGRLLTGLGVLDVPQIGEAGDDLLVVSIEGLGTANLVHLKY